MAAMIPWHVAQLVTGVTAGIVAIEGTGRSAERPRFAQIIPCANLARLKFQPGYERAQS